MLTLLLMYVYGMVGWILFHEEDPEQWGNIGEAMLSLFQILTLENWPTFLEAGQEIHPASWIFFVSYVLIASFLVINILIAIIINSMEEVHAAEKAGRSRPTPRRDRGASRRARSPTGSREIRARVDSSRRSSPRAAATAGAGALGSGARPRAGGCGPSFRCCRRRPVGADSRSFTSVSSSAIWLRSSSMSS